MNFYQIVYYLKLFFFKFRSALSPAHAKDAIDFEVAEIWKKRFASGRLPHEEEAYQQRMLKIETNPLWRGR